LVRMYPNLTPRPWAISTSCFRCGKMNLRYIPGDQKSHPSYHPRLTHKSIPSLRTTFILSRFQAAMDIPRSGWCSFWFPQPDVGIAHLRSPSVFRRDPTARGQPTPGAICPQRMRRDQPFLTETTRGPDGRRIPPA
jgi:hypothetical protein